MNKRGAGIILGVIPARGGSKGIPGKNLRQVLGKPLIGYTVEEALAFKSVDKVIVTTDSPAIAATARSFGAEVPFLRPKALARDRSSMLDVLKHALRTCERLYGIRIDGIFLFDPSSPLRDEKDLAAMAGLFRREKPDLVVAVSPCRRNPYFNMLKAGRNSYAGLVLKGRFIRRQDAPPIFDITNNGWLFSRRAVLRGWRLPRRTIAYEVRSVTIDIDREEDLDLLEFFMKRRGTR